MKLAVVMVASLIVSENDAVTVVVRTTPVAPADGAVAMTVGAVTSGVAPVVNVSAKLLASALPDASFTAVVTVTEYSVLGAKFAVGVNVGQPATGGDTGGPLQSGVAVGGQAPAPLPAEPAPGGGVWKPKAEAFKASLENMRRELLK